jgi:hypothetical protein
LSGIPPGTLVQMRTLRRFAHYNRGETIAVPIEVGRDLEAKRLAQPLHLMVPTPRGDTTGRQPGVGGVVRK